MLDPSSQGSFGPAPGYDGGKGVEEPTLERRELEKRHFYTGCGETLSWNSAWYTQDWFTSSESYYDNQASLGPIDPPTSIFDTDPACIALETTLDISTSKLISTIITSSVSSGTGPSQARRTTLGPVTSTVTTLSSGQTIVITQTKMVSSVITSMSPTLISQLSLNSPSSRPTSIPSSRSDSSIPSSITTCAGGWDWMATGAVSSAIFGLLIGVLVWLAFAGLRKKVPMYLTTMWFLPESRRPAGIPSFLGSFALFSILNFATLRKKGQGPTESPTDAQISVLTVLTALKLAAVGSLFGLATALPLFLVHTPCLEQTSPTSQYGGRLGTLTDLSILRLLNALDPSPGSPVAKQQTEILQRALLSTISPAISNARTRLIILLVLLFVILILPSLFILLRTLFSLLRYRKRWLDKTCGGEEIVWVRATSVMGPEGHLKTIAEGEVMQLAKSLGLAGSGGKERRSKYLEEGASQDGEANVQKGANIRAVFAIPDTNELSKLVQERDAVLNKLERAETLYIQSFWLSKETVPAVRGSMEDSAESPPFRNPIRSSSRLSNRSFRRHLSRPSSTDQQTGGQSAPTTYVAPKSFYQLQTLPNTMLEPIKSTDDIASTSGAQPTFTQEVGTRITGTQFLEVTRDSAFFGGKLPIGTPMKVDEGGLLDVDRSAHLASRADPRSPTTREGTETGNSTPTTSSKPLNPNPHRSRRTRSPELGPYPSNIPLQNRGERRAIAPVVFAGPASRRIEFHDDRSTPRRSSSFEFLPETNSQLRTGHHPAVRPVSGASAFLGSYYNDIKRYRPQLKELNGRINLEQAAVYEDMAEGKAIRGFLLIGRGIGDLGCQVSGRTREDVIWPELQRSRGSPLAFWSLTVLVIFVSAVTITPFASLGIGTAPGFSHYLKLMLPLARNNSLESGIVEGLAASLAIILILVIAVGLIFYFAKCSGAISRIKRRLVGFQGMALLLLVTAAIWVLLSAGLMFSTEDIAEGSQVTRHIADGSVFISWLVFCLLLNVAVIIPGLHLLRPRRLFLYWRRIRKAVTPRDRFRATYPPSFDPSLSFAGCLLAIVYGILFFPIFPLICLPILLFLVLMLVATHYAARYVHVNVEADSGARFAIWALRIFGWVLCTGPLFLGLVLMSRREWVLGGIAMGVSTLSLMVFEALVHSRIRDQPRLDRKDRQALKQFKRALRDEKNTVPSGLEERENLTTRTDQEAIRQRRQSNLSILELITGMAPRTAQMGPLPLGSDSIDDMFSTEQAARAHPSVPPRLPPLPFDGVADQCRYLMYPPELLAPPPVIWLPDDEAGVGRAEAADLVKYHQLKTVVDQGSR